MFWFGISLTLLLNYKWGTCKDLRKLFWYLYNSFIFHFKSYYQPIVGIIETTVLKVYHPHEQSQIYILKPLARPKLNERCHVETQFIQINSAKPGPEGLSWERARKRLWHCLIMSRNSHVFAHFLRINLCYEHPVDLMHTSLNLMCPMADLQGLRRGTRFGKFEFSF